MTRQLAVELYLIFHIVYLISDPAGSQPLLQSTVQINITTILLFCCNEMCFYCIIPDITKHIYYGTLSIQIS